MPAQYITELNGEPEANEGAMLTVIDGLQKSRALHSQDAQAPLFLFLQAALMVLHNFAVCTRADRQSCTCTYARDSGCSSLGK